MSDRRSQIPIGLKPKDLIGIPWRVAFALQADGWYLRQDIIWHKPNPMPESVKDRCTKAHEYIFMLSKSPRYYFDADAIREESKGVWNSSKGFNKDGQSRRNIQGRIGNRADVNQSGRNRRSVWTVTTKPFKGAHFATFPPDLIEPCILAGCPEGGMVLDPFGGAGTTALVALRQRRNAILCELNADYVAMASRRLADEGWLSSVEYKSPRGARNQSENE
jgi:DNA modification methylase